MKKLNIEALLKESITGNQNIAELVEAVEAAKQKIIDARSSAMLFREKAEKLTNDIDGVDLDSDFDPTSYAYKKQAVTRMQSDLEGLRRQALRLERVVVPQIEQAELKPAAEKLTRAITQTIIPVHQTVIDEFDRLITDAEGLLTNWNDAVRAVRRAYQVPSLPAGKIHRKSPAVQAAVN